MNTQTRLVAEQDRPQQWAEQIRVYQIRLSDMKADA